MQEQFSIKHRPRAFADIYGQEAIKKDLQTRALNRSWPKAMLLRGQYGTGKTTAAHIIAMTIQCAHLSKEGNPCGECSSCKSILTERWDRDTVMLDGGTIGQKDSIIEFTSTIGLRPMYDAARIFIIEEADQLSTGAANALLKILESPQKGVYFILLSMQTGGISLPIQSRCQTFNFKPIAVKETMMALRNVMQKENLWEDPKIPEAFKLQGLAAIASSSKGSLREAMQLLERCLVGEYFTPEAIHESLGVVDETTTYNILFGLLNYTKDEAVWNSIANGDPAEQYMYFTLLLSEAMICRETGYVKNEMYADSTRTLAGKPGLEALFTTLTEYPQLTKPYVRKADLLAALASYYAKRVKTVFAEKTPLREIPVRKI